MRTERTFFEVRSWNMDMPKPSKRYPKMRQAMNAAKFFRSVWAPCKFYITQSVCRFDDNGVTVW